MNPARVSGKATTASIIDDFYAGTLDDHAWSRGVLRMAHSVNGASAVLFGIDTSANPVFRAEAHDIGPEEISAFGKTWVNKDIRLKPALQRRVGEPMFDLNLVSMRDLKRSEIFNEFLVRIDKPWLLSFWLSKSDSKRTLLTIHGSLRRGPLDERDAERVCPLIPHLRRALEIRDRLATAKIQTNTLAASINSLRTALMILDAKGRVLEASDTALSMCRRNTGIRLDANGTLRLREPAESELKRWIHSGRPPPRNPDGLLHVARQKASPISVLVTPLPVAAVSWISSDPRWLLMFFDPEERTNASSEIISRDLGISAREALLAALLVSGLDIPQIAERMGISVHTARTHLKSIFAKTGHCSQAQLLRRIASGPAVLAQSLNAATRK